MIDKDCAISAMLTNRQFYAWDCDSVYMNPHAAHDIL
jgi:hypothetical protein